MHSWLLQRSAQLCAPECREEWAVLVGTERVPGECSVFSQLQVRESGLCVQDIYFWSPCIFVSFHEVCKGIPLKCHNDVPDKVLMYKYPLHEYP